MRRSFLVLGLATVASALTWVGEREASACGGCFHPPAQTVTDITDERMLLSVSPTQTTLYDQIQYSGNPASFAWVLPIHGTVTVGLSADVLFDSIDAITATQINPPVPDCPAPPSDCAGGGGSSSGFANAGSSAAADAGAALGVVTVTKQQQVGPYETVQLHATDASALNDWLVQNGFNLPAAVLPVIDAYVTEGFDFLAMKLVPSAGVQAMRPVRVTMPGASLSLPLRMASIGTGATVGITIWVVSDGRYQPQNFPFFHIEDSALIWDFSTSSSNYTTLRAENEAALSGKGWEIESAISVNEQLISNVILSGGQYYGGGGVYGGPTSDAGEDYLPVGTPDDGGTDDGGAAEDGGAGDDAGAYESADQVRDDDIAALFAGMAGPNVTVTRMRSDISHAAMTTDFVLQASPDQSELSNVRQVTQQINQQCPIYSNCQVIGTGSPGLAAPISGTSSVGAAPASGGGCVTSSQANGAPGGRFAILAGLFGLVAARAVRARKRNRRSDRS
jgi:hypothetical protein